MSLVSRRTSGRPCPRVLAFTGSFGFRAAPLDQGRFAAAQQRRRQDSKRIGEIRQASNRGVDEPAFDALRVRQIQACALGQILLGPTAFEPKPLHVATKVQHEFTRAWVGGSRHVLGSANRHGVR